MIPLNSTAQSYKTEMNTGLQQRINNAASGCVGLFIQGRWLIFYFECVGGCAITEVCFSEAFPLAVGNDSACGHDEKDYDARQERKNNLFVFGLDLTCWV